MKIEFLNQPDLSFSEIIKEALINYNVVSIATAYLTESGLQLFKQQFQTKSIKILCGIHGCISDLNALKTFSLSTNKFQGHVFKGTNIFHPKLYIFQNENTAEMLVGSSNFTGAGLNRNEEALVRIIGSPSISPILNAIEYFNNLWNNNSVSVEKYLLENPNYKLRVNLNENILPEQIKILEKLKENVKTNFSFSFKNKVNKISLLRDGKQTIHTEFNPKIDKFGLCKLHKAVPFKIILPDNSDVAGQIYYYKRKKKGSYYQLKLSGSYNIGKLRSLVKIEDYLHYQIDMESKTIKISKS